ncbi:PH domain-containing protein [Nocardioides sp. Iso805N]|uniref:PH domain-containing protein n=1 Tax=Nocardioides sp. Iso805N TaxID=1283287 RepID=UPI00037C2C04|nr:PH domain-containing protein [Nocardioides sp. Iso805N]
MSSSPTLREPSRRVSPKAPAYWRARIAAAGVALWCAAIVVAVLAARTHGWWTPLLWLAAALLLLVPIPWLLVVPRLRYRIHRWEITDIAVHVRYGWLDLTDEIVPLSRVQTVDSTQGPLMRLFGLRTVTVRTASSAGHVEIACLPDDLAQQVVAQLVTIAGATPEDAT